jgi:acyl carrier protein
MKALYMIIPTFNNKKINNMDFKEFISNFAAELDETSEDMLTADTDFKALDEWSSLTALSIIAMIEDNYEVEVGGDDLRSCTTLNDLFNLISSQYAG